MAHRKGDKRERATLESATVWLIHPTRSLTVSRTSHGKEAVKFSQTSEPGIAYGYWAESKFTFRVVERNRPIAEGAFTLLVGMDRKPSLRTFSIAAVDNDMKRESIDDSFQLVDERFKKMLLKVVFHTPFLMRGRWYEQGEVIYLKDGKPIRAPREGRFIPGRSDFRRPRNSERNWQDPTEIEVIVDLYNKAAQALPPDSTQRDIETWIARTSGVWSPGTVHRQLQIAREHNKIKRKKRGRKGKK